MSDLHKVGPDTAARIVEHRDLAIAGQADPISVTDLASIRLSVDYWQDLVDTKVIDLEPPTGLLKPKIETEKTEAATSIMEKRISDKLQNKFDKSLKIYFDRIDKKIDDNVAPVQKKLDNVSSNLDKKLEQLGSTVEELALALQNERANRLSQESGFDKKSGPNGGPFTKKYKYKSGHSGYSIGRNSWKNKQGTGPNRPGRPNTKGPNGIPPTPYAPI